MGALRTLVAALLAVGCGTVEDSFVGRYEGTYSCEGQSTGGPVSEGPTDQTVAIEMDRDGGIYIAGQCTIPLQAISGTRAEVVRSGCNTTLAGDPATVTFDSGVLELNEPRLGYSINYIVVYFDGWTVQSTCRFLGFRVG